MDKSDEMEALRKHGRKLQKEISRTNRELTRALRDAASGRVGRALRVLESRFEDYADLTFELGKVTAQIRDLRTQGDKHEERGWERDWSQVHWEEQAAPVAEDRLAWLRLDEPKREPAEDERHPQHEREERVLGEVPHDREPEDRLAWLGLDEPKREPAEDERHHQHEREARAQEEVLRNREPEDDLDEWRR
jgi:hypothetical protein